MFILGYPLPRVSFLRHSSLSLLTSLSSSRFNSTLQRRRSRFTMSASLSTQESTQHPPLISETPHKSRNRWKPMCLYYTQGKCTMMDDSVHLEKFNHSCSVELEVSSVKSTLSQQFDFFLVLDLEGKVEILEFPVMLLDAKTMNVVDMFHRTHLYFFDQVFEFVRPSAMSEKRINEYIEGKYGKLGVDRVWHDTAVPFEEVIQQFEAWMAQHHLWGEESGGRLVRAAFVTCGNWDLKTKVPEQCEVAGMVIPPYFMEWINLKDVYLNFYKRRATGMMTMMRELQIPLVGSHHLGIDDTKNITRVVLRMLSDGAFLKITARRDPIRPEKVEFLFKNRVR